MLLDTGKYTVRVTASSGSGAPLPPVGYTLRGLIRSLPIGPTPINTTLNPVGTTPSSPTPDPGNVTTSDKLFTVLSIYQTDAFGNPWPN